MTSEAPKDYKSLTKKYFTKLQSDVYKCHCGKLLKRKDGTGWSNLMQHIHTQHGNDKTSTSDQQVIRFMHCRKSEAVYGWLEWVCMELKPFSFVEISSNTQIFVVGWNICSHPWEAHAPCFWSSWESDRQRTAWCICTHCWRMDEGQFAFCGRDGIIPWKTWRIWNCIVGVFSHWRPNRSEC